MQVIPELAKAQNKKIRRKRVLLPGVSPPNRAIADYKRSLDSLVKAMIADIATNLVPMLKERESEYINDSLRSDLLDIIKRIANRFSNITVFATTLARKNAIQVNGLQKDTFINKANRALGIDLDALFEGEDIKSIINEHVKENVKLIKSIPEQFFDRVENVVTNGLKNGIRAKDLAAQLLNKGKQDDVKQTGVAGITLRRAKLIARDQTNKLNGVITRARHKKLGITHYIWRDSGDNRVRPLHVELNGQEFAWEGEPQPPEGLAPGMPINCRCTAEGIIEF